MQYRLSDITALNHDVTRLTLVPESGDGVEFFPGQYLEIVLGDDVRCAYSIACAPRADNSLELHVRAMPQSESYVQLACRLVKNSLFEIALPFGMVCFDGCGSGPLLLLAGSTGFSQAKAIIERWVQLKCGQPLWVYWGGRSARDLYLNEWMQDLAAQFPLLRYVPVVSDGDPQWQGRTGFVHNAVLKDVANLKEITVVGCGSPAMVYAAFDDFILAGLPAARFLSDVFAYAPR